MKKSLVFVTNCAAYEMSRYLQASPRLARDYDVDIFMTYVMADDTAARATLHHALAKADAVVVQNVQTIDWLRNDALTRHIRKDCRVIRLAFWRFDGFWPIPLPRFAQPYWYMPDEFGELPDPRAYFGKAIAPALIKSHFDRELDKLAAIDPISELPMLPFFLDNYRCHDLFPDHWHPSTLFFHKVSRYILAQLDIPDDIPLLPDYGPSRERHRFVLDSVADALELRFDRTLVRFHHQLVAREVLFRFVRDRRETLRRAEAPQECVPIFAHWCDAQGLAERPYNVAALGRASQSSHSEWSAEGEAQRAVGPDAMSFAFHTEHEPAPWWAVDLLAFREVTAIRIWNRDHDIFWSRALPLTIAASQDGHTWTDLATIAYEFSGLDRGTPLHLEFPKPLLIRHVRLQVRRPSVLHLARVEVLANVVT